MPQLQARPRDHFEVSNGRVKVNHGVSCGSGEEPRWTTEQRIQQHWIQGALPPLGRLRFLLATCLSSAAIAKYTKCQKQTFTLDSSRHGKLEIRVLAWLGVGEGLLSFWAADSPHTLCSRVAKEFHSPLTRSLIPSWGHPIPQDLS